MLGFVVRWIQALRDQAGDVVVIANDVRAVPVDMNAEVVSLGKERGNGRARRLAMYEVELLRLARSQRIDALFAHMCPIYLNMAAPVLRAFNIPMMLWFAHPRNSASLASAERLSARVLTSFPGAYPRSSPKVEAIGQGIDVDRITPSPVPEGQAPLRLLTLGRTSPAKGLPTVIRALARLGAAGVDSTLSIVGPSTTTEEQRHRDELLRLAKAVGVQERLDFRGGVARARLRDVLGEAHVVVSATAAGSGDKVVLEAMAAGRPVVASNPVFGPLLSGLPHVLSFREGDPDSLAETLAGLALSGVPALNTLGTELRCRVERSHSVEHWAGRVVEAATSVVTTHQARR